MKDLSNPHFLANAGVFRNRARHCLRKNPQAEHDDPHAWHRGPSDFSLNPDALAEISRGTRASPDNKPAAVLIPIIAHASELTVLLTRRAEHLPSHAGQIAFPGGKFDAGDDSPLATALREAHEEIGLAQSLVEPLGYLDCYRTGSGYRVTPVVALVQPGFNLNPDPREVSAAFEVPLSFLMNTANHQEHTRKYGGRERRFYAMPYGEHFIWGATAGILRNMHERLFGP